MQKQSCDNCGESFGLNELVSVFDETLCHKCTDSRLENTDPEQNTEKSVHRLVDRTVCTRCQADNGTEEFELFLDMPFCDNCREHAQHYPFPLWVKTACLGLLMIAIFSISYNLRFFKARILMDRSMELAFGQGQIVEASKQMETASTLVPESSDLKIMFHYFSSAVALQEEDYEGGLEHLNHCLEMPVEYQVDVMILRCEIALAFDNEKYDEFLRLSKLFEDAIPDNATSIAQVSSAYACLYAANGKEEDKENSLEYLKEAESINGDSPDAGFEEYRDRILHRIETRQILSAEDYRKLTGTPLSENDE